MTPHPAAPVTSDAPAPEDAAPDTARDTASDGAASAGAEVPGLWAVVPAGGAGTRLWPLSRAGHPKFLLDLTGSGRTLLQATVDRLRPLVGDRVVVVTGAAHRDAVLAQLPDLDPARVLAEPSPKDSMAAIGWAAATVERLDPGALVASFAADHVITDLPVFHRAVRDAADAARAGYVATIGIEPTHPATGFGYVESGDPIGGGPALAVRSFVEKPDAATAAGYLARGGFRWNAGMFVAGAGVLLDALAEQLPALAEGLRAVAADPSALDAVWPGLTRIAIDHAVAEPLGAQGRLACVPGAFGWDDVGDVDAVARLVGADGPVAALGAPALAVDATGAVLSATGRPVVLVDVDDLVVVDTPDAVLVVPRGSAQRVKEAVDAVRAAGRTDLL